MSRLLFGFWLLGLCHWRGRYRSQRPIERLLGVVRFEFTRLVDELLALRSGVCHFGFGLGHIASSESVSLGDLLAHREVRHG